VSHKWRRSYFYYIFGQIWTRSNFSIFHSCILRWTAEIVWTKSMTSPCEVVKFECSYVAYTFTAIILFRNDAEFVHSKCVWCYVLLHVCTRINLEFYNMCWRHTPFACSATHSWVIANATGGHWMESIALLWFCRPRCQKWRQMTSAAHLYNKKAQNASVTCHSSSTKMNLTSGVHNRVTMRWTCYKQPNTDSSFVIPYYLLTICSDNGATNDSLYWDTGR